tara:strand:- start:1129 stop:1407 length:279 start_codon:yes stop_codon:yes gene_type:complete
MNNDLIVLVKKYFDKVNGNTYHSVQFEIDNKIYHSGKTYGYGRQYEETFYDLCMGILKDKSIAKYVKDFIKAKYIVIENCKAKELKQIHEYK